MTSNSDTSASLAGQSQRERVSLSDIEARLPETPASAQTPRESLSAIYNKLPPLQTPPTFQQFEGARLAKIILWFICALAIGFLAAWWFTRPSIADVRQILSDAANGKERLEVLQALRAEHFGTLRELFQLVVSSVLVPLFTLLAGYAFGAGQVEKQE